MTSSSPTMIVAHYRLRPQRKDQWLKTWQHLALIAGAMPECQTFLLEVDPAEPDRCSVISSWSSGAAFDRFVREVGLTWIERSLDYCRLPPRFARFSLRNGEPLKPTERQSIRAGA